MAAGCVDVKREVPSKLPDNDPEVSRRIHLGRIVYQQHCTSCHDTNGDGRTFSRGSNIRKKADELSREDVLKSLRDGIGEMPAYRDQLTESQMQAVTDYVMLDLFVNE